MVALATWSELELFAGQEFVAARAEQVLGQISEDVRTYCGWHIAGAVTEAITIDGSGADILDLPTLRLTAVNSVQEDGAAVDVGDIEWSTKGYLKRSSKWTDKLRGVVVNITHGYTTTPLDIGELVMTRAARSLISPLGTVRDQEQIGDYSYNRQYVDPGWTDSETRVLDRYRIENPA